MPPYILPGAGTRLSLGSGHGLMIGPTLGLWHERVFPRIPQLVSGYNGWNCHLVTNAKVKSMCLKESQWKTCRLFLWFLSTNNFAHAKQVSMQWVREMIASKTGLMLYTVLNFYHIRYSIFFVEYIYVRDTCNILHFSILRYRLRCVFSCWIKRVFTVHELDNQ